MNVCCELLQVDNQNLLPFSRGLFGRVLETCMNRNFWDNI